MRFLLRLLSLEDILRHTVPLIVILATSSVAAAQSTKPIFQGLGITLTKSADVMTDEQTCSLVVDHGGLLIAIMGPNQFAIVPIEKTLIAPDEEHLIRVGSDKAIPLTYIPNRNALTVNDPSVAATACQRNRRRQ